MPTGPARGPADSRLSGDVAGALWLSRELLPDEERMLGPDHPS